MIGDQEQRGGIGEGLVVGIPPRIGVPVRADDGEILDLAVEAAGDPPFGGIAGEETILVHDDDSTHRASLLSSFIP